MEPIPLSRNLYEAVLHLLERLEYETDHYYDTDIDAECTDFQCAGNDLHYEAYTPHRTDCVWKELRDILFIWQKLGEMEDSPF